jgi:hypothetical protein
MQVIYPKHNMLEGFCVGLFCKGGSWNYVMLDSPRLLGIFMLYTNMLTTI